MAAWRSVLLALTCMTALGAYACSSLGASDFTDAHGRNPGDEEGSRGGASDGPNGGAAPGLAPTDNAVVLVHAAGTGAFRLCFENYPLQQATPDSDLMPEANVVGVEVGSAVRLPPFPTPPGDVYLFKEALQRVGESGVSPTTPCGVMLDNAPPGILYEKIGRIDDDLSKGVHLLVVKGCQVQAARGPLYDTARCGSDYTGASNLSLKVISLSGQERAQGELPAQVIHLSQAIESDRATRPLEIAFGDLDAGTDSGSRATAPTLYGDPKQLVATPKFQAPSGDDLSIYANVGFTVRYANGAPVELARQSLADVQRLSAPRDIPTTYYAVASNYVLLLLGDPAPKYVDGGPIEGDSLRRPHLLAIPVVNPVDAGAGSDAAAPETDGGS